MIFRRRIADRIILCPTQHPITAAGLRCVRIPFSGGYLEAFVCRIEGARELPASEIDERLPAPELLVLKLPGTAGRAERTTPFPAPLSPARSSEVWTWNPPGYGRSDGVPTMQGMSQAVLEFYDRVMEWRRGEEIRVWICGNSLGCATGLYLASKRPVDGLILRNPPPLVHLVQGRDAWWNLGIGGRIIAAGIPTAMDALSTAPLVSAPIVFIESEADKLVTPAMQALVREAHHGPQRRIVLRGAAHDSPIDEQYHGAMVESLAWLWHQARMAA